MIRIAIYARKSKFTAKGESIENQIRECEQYISTILKKRIFNIHGDSEITTKIYKDEGYSGKNLDRPQFKQMMMDNSIEPYNYIVVYRLDRVSRNLADFSQLITKLKLSDTSFVSYKEDFDTATPMGQAMMSIAAVFAQLERDTIAERIKDNMYQLAKLGRWTGGTTPLGYKSVRHTRQDGTKTRTHYTLEIDESQLASVKVIFNKYIELQSINAVEFYLNQHHYTTQRGKQWDKSNVRRILTNPIYCPADETAYNYFSDLGCVVCFTEEEFSSERGILPYNRTDGSRKLNPVDKWIIAASTHQPIVTSEQWIHVQQILLKNSKTCFGGTNVNRVAKSPTSLLSGILKCKCGAYMRPKIYGSGNMFYKCERKVKTKKTECDVANINGDELDALVLDEILSFDTPGTNIQSQLQQLEKRIASIEQDTQDEINRLYTQKATNDSAIRNLIKALSMDLYPETMKAINAEIKELNAKNEDLDSQILQLSSHDIIKSSLTGKLKDIKDVMYMLRENFEVLSIHQRREFIKQIVDTIIWDGEHIHIFIKGSIC